jgi:hypothetical protein
MTHKGKDIKQAFSECYLYHSETPNPPDTIGQWKLKLISWLTNSKPPKANGTAKSKSDELANGFAERAEKYRKIYGDA